MLLGFSPVRARANGPDDNVSSFYTRKPYYSISSFHHQFLIAVKICFALRKRQVAKAVVDLGFF